LSGVCAAIDSQSLSASRESLMSLQTLTPVHATRDLQRGRHTVVKHGSHGKVVDSWPNWSSTTYSVEFTPVPGATVTLTGLTEGDVQPD
jgi:hypothetical protein